MLEHPAVDIFSGTGSRINSLEFVAEQNPHAEVLNCESRRRRELVLQCVACRSTRLGLCMTTCVCIDEAGVRVVIFYSPRTKSEWAKKRAGTGIAAWIAGACGS